MSKHVALFPMYNTYYADKYSILALFPDNETPKLSDLSHILYKKKHLKANCRLEWIETGQVIEGQ